MSLGKSAASPARSATASAPFWIRLVSGETSRSQPGTLAASPQRTKKPSPSVDRPSRSKAS